jgi:glutamine amidotransferase
MIGIIDYGAGNIFSISNALKKNEIKNKIITCEKDFYDCRKLIIPGVGAFSSAIDKLKTKNFFEIIKEHQRKGHQIVGICLGMQILFSKGNENGIESNGLDFIKGNVKKINPNINNEKIYRLPHIGWSKINIDNNYKNYFKNCNLNNYYFVHSYACINEDKKTEIVAKCKYGNTEFNCFVKKDNIYGMQFHPERSGASGLNLLNNLLK